MSSISPSSQWGNDIPPPYATDKECVIVITKKNGGGIAPAWVEKQTKITWTTDQNARIVVHGDRMRKVVCDKSLSASDAAIILILVQKIASDIPCDPKVKLYNGLDVQIFTKNDKKPAFVNTDTAMGGCVRVMQHSDIAVTEADSTLYRDIMQGIEDLIIKYTMSSASPLSEFHYPNRIEFFTHRRESGDKVYDYFSVNQYASDQILLNPDEVVLEHDIYVSNDTPELYFHISVPVGGMTRRQLIAKIETWLNARNIYHNMKVLSEKGKDIEDHDISPHVASNIDVHKLQREGSETMRNGIPIYCRCGQNGRLLA